MASPPMITLIIPTYNAMGLLPGCINSIIDVAGELLGESILVRIQDGLSQDGIVDYIDGLPHEGISLSHEKDDGIYDAMNKAILAIETPWVYFLGADDRLLPGFMAVLARLGGTNSIYYGNVLYSSDMKQYDGKFTALKLVYRNICHQAIFYPSEILLEKPFQTKYPIKADWASNICLMSDYDFIYLNQDIAIFNNQDGTSSRNEDKIFNADKNELFHVNFGVFLYLMSLAAPLLTAIYQAFKPPRR